MADYDLLKLGAREFEHLVQAVGKKAIANGLTPFGDGADGAREATFEGPMDYPSGSNSWDGYLVVQAKFKQRPFVTPSANGTWFINEISADLDKFLDPDRQLRKPDYYLAATNIQLTPVADNGTRDKAEKTLESYSERLGLKGFDIWAYDDTCRFLDGNLDIRSSFAHLTTSGDVLTKLATKIDLFEQPKGSTNRMSHLIDRFKEERNNDVVFQGIVAKLQHYSTSTDALNGVEGLTKKLGDAGYDNYLTMAMQTKELFAKKLAEFQFSKTAQEIQCMLLADVYVRFHNSVWPSLCEKKEQREIQQLVQTDILNPIAEMLGENVLDIYSDEILGMIYFLTGNCHIKWSNI